MNAMRRRALDVAVLVCLGAASDARAVHVNPKLLGSVLIYPYYTVRSDVGPGHYYDNYFSIVNDTASTKAVKVRFLEAMRGAEVLSFNLYLSPFDAWTGGVVRTNTAGDGEEGAKLISTDRSCVMPAALFSTAGANTLNRFKNFSYSGASADGGGSALDRAREGYLEVIEMGEFTNTTAIAAARHDASGVPANCGYFVAQEASLGAQMIPPAGGLHGALSLINVRAGTDYSYDAIALDQWSPTVVQFTPAGSPEPSIAPAGASTVSNILTAGGVVSSTWSNSRDAVSAAMMQSRLYNEWMVEAETVSGTDWIVTFPTKRLYVAAGAGAATPPFNANFNNAASCDIYERSFYNREGAISPAEIAILPATVPGPVYPIFAFCYAANNLTFRNSNMLGSPNAYHVDPAEVGRSGHATVTFEQPGQFLTPLATTINGVAAGAQRHFGLPVVGFMIQDYSNGNVGTPPVYSSYGGSFAHRYLSRIAP